MTRLLLDTHVYVWARTGKARVPRDMRAAMETAESVFLSIVTAWELAILQGLGRMRLSETFGESLARGGYRLLPIELRHAEAVTDLPQIHRDPFDRMLVAQARVEGLTLATVDRNIARYDVTQINR